jgi:hypothetical protein
MANTYTLISSVTVGSGGAATIDFTSIPSTYTDLLVKISGRSNNTGSFANYLRFNSDSGNNYLWRNLYGYNGATYSDASGGGISYVWGGYTNNSSLTASAFGNSEIYIPSYLSSNYKSVSADGVMETNAANGVSLGIGANLWNNTAAITAITLLPSVGNYAQYSTAYLYGISNA